ncbi:thioredoxin family protein [Rubritalea tangerina]|uniref:Thioredoxin family protein n=1 Tax=Rubritalea tangerina TaxID=430798 RepID=A0ABW4Z9T9_9BACT
MWKKALPPSVGLLFLIGAISCDQVGSLVSEVTGDNLPKERRAGIKRVHKASADDLRVWLAEPNVLVVLDFYSDTCPPCKAMDPALDKMAEKYADKSAIMKLNVGKPGELATIAMNEYKISETPVLKFYLNGEEVKEMRGIQTEEDLDLAFNKYTSKIKGEFTMREGELPGMKVQRTVEEMMVRTKKGELPKGFVRAKVPEEADDVTKGLPDNVLSAGPPPAPTIPNPPAQ